MWRRSRKRVWWRDVSSIRSAFPDEGGSSGEFDEFGLSDTAGLVLFLVVASLCEKFSVDAIDSLVVVAELAWFGALAEISPVVKSFLLYSVESRSQVASVTGVGSPAKVTLRVGICSCVALNIGALSIVRVWPLTGVWPLARVWPLVRVLPFA